MDGLKDYLGGLGQRATLVGQKWEVAATAPCPPDHSARDQIQVSAGPVCASGFWPQENAAEQGQEGRRWHNWNKKCSQEVAIPALGGSLTSLGLRSFLVKSS